ncbi:MAG TPA: prepilin-type N-terminal cleavage/methylation domain-containing protein [Candidatus Nanoarchaeia archaeon]
MHSLLSYLKFHREGFTLIELLIAITILAIISAFGIASFNSATRSNAVLQQAQELKVLARKLRTDARAATKPSGCVNNGVVYGTYITFNQAANSYTYGISCFNSTTGASFSTQTTKTLKVPVVIDAATPYQRLTVLFSFDGTTAFYNFAFNPNTFSHVTAPSSPIPTDPTYLQVVSTSTIYRVYFSSTGLVCEQKSTVTTVCAQ